VLRIPLKAHGVYQRHNPPQEIGPWGTQPSLLVKHADHRQIRWTEKKQQVPPLRYAPVGMTKWRAAAHIGMGGGGWTEETAGLSFPLQSG
jgi:hypothetical protein